IEHVCIIADRQNAYLFRRQPEREVAGVMLDQKSDEAFVRAERRAMDAERNFVGVIAIFVAQVESAWLREIDLVGCDGKLAADRAPGLHVDLRSVKGRFVRYFDIID